MPQGAEGPIRLLWMSGKVLRGAQDSGTLLGRPGIPASDWRRHNLREGRYISVPGLTKEVAEFLAVLGDGTGLLSKLPPTQTDLEKHPDSGDDNQPRTSGTSSNLPRPRTLSRSWRIAKSIWVRPAAVIAADWSQIKHSAHRRLGNLLADQVQVRLTSWGPQ